MFYKCLFHVPLQVPTITNDFKPFQMEVCLQAQFVGEGTFMTDIIQIQFKLLSKVENAMICTDD